MTTEIWKPVPYATKYEASSEGRLRNKKSKYLFSKKVGVGGYFNVVFPDDSGNKRQKSLQIVIAETFIPNPHNKEEVNHINGIRTDNRMINLEWVTHRENMNKKVFPRITKCNPVRPVVQMDIYDNIIKVWKNAVEAGKGMSIPPASIVRVCKGTRKMCGGYKWRYEISEVVDTAEEKWKEVEIRRSKCKISSLGNIFTSIKSITSGYLAKDACYKTYMGKNVHVLVAKQFCDGYKKGLVVNHIDGNKLNNSASNLEWITPKQNSIHARKMGKCSTVNCKKVAKLKDSTVLETYDSIKLAAEKNGLKQANICKVCKGERKTCGGFSWCYV